MSELSAKHKALTLLRVLTTEKDCKSQSQTSPRPDLTRSQEVLAGKYRELATLLATQHRESKTIARLQSVDLVSREVKRVPSPSPRGQRHPGSQLRRKKHRTVAPEFDDGPKIIEIPSSEEESKRDAIKINLDLEQPPKSLLQRKKRVSFLDARLRVVANDDASSSPEVSDTEVIRSVLQSPRKVLTGQVNVHPRPPPRSRRRAVNQQANPSKRKLRKGRAKYSLKEGPQRSESPSRLPETAPTKKENHLSDNKLSSSSNPDVLSWLKEKKKIIRRQKRNERKKERKEHLEEQKLQDEKLRRWAESEDKVTQWMKHKKSETLTNRSVERKVQREAKQREALEVIERVKESNQIPSLIKSTTVSNNTASGKSKGRKCGKTAPSTKENVVDNQRRFDEETRHHLVRNLETERLHAEEKRQKKAAEKRRKKLLGELDQETQTTNKSDNQSSRRASSKSPDKAKRDESRKGNTAVTNRKNMPSSNPFKGLSYDEWCRQKQTDQRKRAKEAKKQEVCDPELDELIPLLARRRIEQIKVRASRVDSGLRKSRDSSNCDQDKTEATAEAPKGVRPYMWKASSSDKKPAEKKKANSSKRNRLTDKEDPISYSEGGDSKQSAAPMPDVINFERPEPQGCEGTDQSSCQSLNANQSKEPRDLKTNQPNGDTPIKKTEQTDSKKRDPVVTNDSPQSEAIFLTDQNIQGQL